MFSATAADTGPGTNVKAMGLGLCPNGWHELASPADDAALVVVGEPGPLCDAAGEHPINVMTAIAATSRTFI